MNKYLEVSPEVRAALAAGIHVGPASGRALPAITPTFGGDERYVKTALATNGMRYSRRNGPTATFQLGFQGQYSRFSDMAQNMQQGV